MNPVDPASRDPKPPRNDGQRQALCPQPAEFDPDDLPGFKSADGPADGAAVVGLAVLVQHLGRDLALAHISQSGFIIGEAGDGLGHSFIDGR